jgi:hypothetical protein
LRTAVERTVALAASLDKKLLEGTSELILERQVGNF